MRAGVAQLAERQPSKLNVASSNLVSRSILHFRRFSQYPHAPSHTWTGARVHRGGILFRGGVTARRVHVTLGAQSSRWRYRVATIFLVATLLSSLVGDPRDCSGCLIDVGADRRREGRRFDANHQLRQHGAAGRRVAGRAQLPEVRRQRAERHAAERDIKMWATSAQSMGLRTAMPSATRAGARPAWPLRTRPPRPSRPRARLVGAVARAPGSRSRDRTPGSPGRLQRRARRRPARLHWPSPAARMPHTRRSWSSPSSARATVPSAPTNVVPTAGDGQAHRYLDGRGRQRQPDQRLHHQRHSRGAAVPLAARPPPSSAASRTGRRTASG